MRPESIRRLQEQLRLIAQHSQNLPLVSVDGIYNEETENAVRAFQQLFNLNPTGEVDFDTWEAINEVYLLVLEQTSDAESITPFDDCELVGLGDKNATVLVVQVMLDAIADEFNNLRRVGPTGTFDATTEAAVKDLQSINALDANGRVDKRTWNALARLFNNHAKREC